MLRNLGIWLGLVVLTQLPAGCTQETQNKLKRGIQNWTGTDGVMDVISEGEVMYRFIKVDKMTTALATGGGEARDYRYGYGVFDKNLNYVKDDDEVRVYFEVSSFGTQYVFYENPHRATKKK